jgi:putative ABC transport system substrate-binding protein
MRSFAAELVALSPDVILANGSPAVEALQQASSTVPTVFLGVVDPVGAGYVANLAQPGGNATGFTLFEYSMGGKWPELLKEIAPNTKRVAVLREPVLPSAIGQFAAIQSAAPSFGVEVSPVDMRDAGGIERAIAAMARGSNGGLIVPMSALAVTHRDLIIALAARHRVASGLSTTPFRKWRRPHLLRARYHRPLQTCGRLY